MYIYIHIFIASSIAMCWLYSGNCIVNYAAIGSSLKQAQDINISRCLYVLHVHGDQPTITAQSFDLLCSILCSRKKLCLNLTVLLEYIHLYHLYNTNNHGGCSIRVY